MKQTWEEKAKLSRKHEEELSRPLGKTSEISLAYHAIHFRYRSGSLPFCDTFSFRRIHLQNTEGVQEERKRVAKKMEEERSKRWQLLQEQNDVRACSNESYS